MKYSKILKISSFNISLKIEIKFLAQWLIHSRYSVNVKHFTLDHDSISNTIQKIPKDGAIFYQYKWDLIRE